MHLKWGTGKNIQGKKYPKRSSENHFTKQTCHMLLYQDCCEPQNRWKYLKSSSGRWVGLLFSNAMSDWDQQGASVSARQAWARLMASSLLWEYTLVGRLMLCLLNIENHCVLHRQRVITPTSTCDERSYGRTDAPSAFQLPAARLYVPPFFFYFHLSSSTPPPQPSPPPPPSSYVALPHSLTVS